MSLKSCDPMAHPPLPRRANPYLHMTRKPANIGSSAGGIAFGEPGWGPYAACQRISDAPIPLPRQCGDIFGETPGGLTSWSTKPRLGPRSPRSLFRPAALRRCSINWGATSSVGVQFDALTDTAVETSAIEGEPLSIASVRASLARRLDMPLGDYGPTDARAEGVVAVTVDEAQRADRELTEARLHHWHRLIFPDPDPQLTVGAWLSRPDDSMQVISHAERLQPTVHFEAPPGPSVYGEMNRFLNWFASPGPAPMQRPLIHAAVAHLWFVTIHPYGDGNGRIGRAIADLALARHDPEVAE